MNRDIERFNTNGLKIIILLHDAITRVDLTEYNKLRNIHFKYPSKDFRLLPIDGSLSLQNEFFKPNFENKKYGRDTSVSKVA